VYVLPEVSNEPAVYASEATFLLVLAAIIWGLIFFGGRSEWQHGIPTECSDMCAECGKGDLSFRTTGCRRCKTGYLNGGMKCYTHLEDLPSVKTGAALGGGFYYYAIIVAQVLGASWEVMLLVRLRRRGLIGKEMFVAASALLVELLRMAFVDSFILRTYFFNQSYQIYGLSMTGDLQLQRNTTGPDANQFVVAWSNLKPCELDVSKCSIFSRDSPLLDYDESFGWGTGGHPRFRTIGWVIGGEFAMYYFFAAVVNEVADNLFIIPTTTLRYGFKCKVLSVILELFQL